MLRTPLRWWLLALCGTSACSNSAPTADDNPALSSSSAVESIALSLTDSTPSYDESVAITAKVTGTGPFSKTIYFYEDPGTLSFANGDGNGSANDRSVHLGTALVTDAAPTATLQMKLLAGDHQIYALIIKDDGASVESSTLPISIAPAVRVPRAGHIYLGGTTDGQLDSVEHAVPPKGIGRPFAIDIDYVNKVNGVVDWSQLAQEYNASGPPSWDASMADDIANGRIPLVSWACDAIDTPSQADMGTDYDIQTARSPEIDVVRKTARVLKQYPGPVMLRWKWEFNGFWGNHGVCDGMAATARKWTPKAEQNFVGAWQRIWMVFQEEGATNVVFVWNPFYYANDASDTFPGQMYPGNTFVDWIGVDTYQGLNSNDPLGTGPFAGDMSPFYEDFTASQYAGKPLIVGENGAPSTDASTDHKEHQWSYLNGAWSDFGGSGAASDAFPAVRAYNWFDEANSTLDNDAGAAGDHGGMLAMAQMAADPNIFFRNNLSVSAHGPTELVTGDTYAPRLALTNTGLLPLTEVELTAVDAIEVTEGRGSVSLATVLPASFGVVAAGQQVRPSLSFAWPASAMCVEMTYHYRATQSDGTGSTTSYTGANTIVIARTPDALCVSLSVPPREGQLQWTSL